LFRVDFGACLRLSAGGENVWDFEAENVDFLSKIALQKRKMSKMFACGGLRTLKAS
jgi:hypothetical protein